MSSTDTRRSGRHPVDIGHLVMGVALLGLVGVWALFEGSVVEGADLHWFLPIPWLAAGAAGLVALTVAARRKGRRVPARPDAHPSTDTDTDNHTVSDTTEEIR